MVQVYAVGRVKHRRDLVGYKLLNISDFSLKDYSLDKIIKLLKSGSTIGNLYIDEETGELKEYYCDRTLTEYTQNGKRIGKGRDTFLTVYTDSCSAGLSHYHSSEVYYSRDGLIEIKDILDLNYIQHYDVDVLKDCIPFLNDEPVDMYVKNFMKYYEIQNEKDGLNTGIIKHLSNMGMLKYEISKNLDSILIDFCRALESITLFNGVQIKEINITDKCESILPHSLMDLDCDKIIFGNVSICSKSFCNSKIKYIDLKDVNRNSKDDMFENCKVKHLVLPKWYDSWNILDSFNHKIETLEITNTSCTNSIWEIDVKDKLLFRKVENLLLPADFEYEQEKYLRDELIDVNIIRNIDE